MIFEVEMHAFAKGKIRLVDVPDAAIQQWRSLPTETRTQKYLGFIFEYGQEDFQPRGLPSVSVGDVIRLDGFRWAVMPSLFKLLTADFMPPHDGGVWAYKLSLVDEA
jgi:hypothetical protein